MRRTMMTLTGLLALSLACEDEPESADIDPEQAAVVEEAAETAPETEGAEAAEAEAPAAQAEPPATATVGEPAPDFTLTDHAGTSHTLSDLRGKVVVLEWVNPDCPYVQRHYQAQTMRNLVEHYEGRDVTWLAIDSSHFVTPESSTEFHEEHDLPYPILQDPEGRVGRLYAAATTPHMYVIDAEGVLRYAGAIDDDPRGREDEPTNHVRQAVDAVLAGESPPTAQTEPYGCTVKYGES